MGKQHETMANEPQEARLALNNRRSASRDPQILAKRPAEQLGKTGAPSFAAELRNLAD